MKQFLFVTIFFLSSCNVIQAIGGGETEIGTSSAEDKGPDLDAIAYFNFEENDFFSSFNSYNNARALTVSADTTDISVNEDYGYALDCSAASSYAQETSLGMSSNEGYTIAFRMKPIDAAAKGIAVQLFESGVTEEISLIKESWGTAGSPGPDLILTINGARVAHIAGLFSNSTWLHVAAVVRTDDYTASLYLNGVEVDTGSGFSGDNSQFNGLHVCNDSSVSNAFTEGIIDSLGVWDRQLSVEEISVLSSNNNSYEQ